MRYLAGFFSDPGNCKNINQDSICLMEALLGEKRCFMGVLCDGMGGELQGEVASAAGVKLFKRWFEKRLPVFLRDKKIKNRNVTDAWSVMLEELNRNICLYGARKGIRCGTTISVILIFDDGRYVCAHVGDSRIYILGRKLKQLTQDQSFVAYEVKHRRMTKEEAKKDERRNILLECVGVNEQINPLFYTGRLNMQRDRILMASDGFCHEISDEEISHLLRKNFKSEEEIRGKLKVVTNMCMKRGERDNITAAVICRSND